MQLIFNNTSGGGNKVKINGLPPSERLNLQETNSIIYEDNAFNDSYYMVSLLEEDGIYYYINRTKLYKFEQNIFTLIGTKADSENTYAATKDKECITVISGNGAGYYINRAENGVFTTLGNTINLNAYDDSIFFIGNDIYFRTNFKPYKVYKSSNFGKDWTDITKKIKLMDGLTLDELVFRHTEGIFNSGNCRYKIFNVNPIERIKFNADTLILSKIKIENLQGNVTTMTRDNRNNREKILCLLAENKPYIRNVYLYKINILENEIKLELLKRTKSSEILGNAICLDEKNEMLVGMLTENNYQSCFFKKLFTKTYIPE